LLEERAVSLLSLFMRQRRVGAPAERTSDINGLQGFPERRGEHDPVTWT
jgi:hypothetical protein